MARSAVRVGLVGLGRMGQNHLRVLGLLKGVDVEFIHDADAALTTRLAQANGVRAVGDIGPALDSVDALIICTPTSTHADYVRQVAGRVKCLFVEKPLADTLAASAELVELGRREGARMQIGFIERFNPAVQQLKRILDRSEQVVSIDFTRTNKVSARITDVDVITDLMIHDIDLAIHLNGPVKSVAAQGVAHGPMIDFASASLTHENGRFSRIQASRITERKIRQIQATCTDAFVDCDLLRKEIIINRQSELQQAAGEPYVITAVEQSVEVRPQEALLAELQAFAAWCADPASISVPTATEGHAAMLVCEQIRRAILG